MDLAVAAKLECLFDRYEMFRAEQNKLDKAIDQLAKSARYKHAYEGSASFPRRSPGAMTFTDRNGRPDPVSNRREIGAYLGLCPSSLESGETDNRKGRITGQGPSRRENCCARRCGCRSAAASRRQPITTGSNGARQANQEGSIVALMRKLGINRVARRPLVRGQQ